MPRPAGPAAAIAGVMVLVLLGGVAGGWWAVRRDEVHEATAVILLSPLLGNPFSPEASGDQLVDLATEAQLVRSDTVAGLVSEDLAGHPAPASLLDGLDVEVPANTQVLQITARAATPEEAARRAQGFADTYLAYRQGRARSEAFDRAARVKEQVRHRTGQLTATTRALAKADAGSAESITLRQQVVDLTSEVGELRRQQAGLESSSEDPGQVVTPAEVARPWLAVGGPAGAAIGGLAGLLLGLTLVLARRRTSLRVRTPDDLAVLGHPVLGPIREGDAEGSRRLRTALLAGLARRPAVVLVAPVVEGREVVAGANELATALGSAGLETLVVDVGDPVREPAGPGLSDVLLGRTALPGVLSSPARKVHALGPGTAADALDDLVDSRETDTLLEWLRKRAEIVLVVAPVATASRTRALLRRTDVVLLDVEETDEVTVTDVRVAADAVTEAGAAVLGIVYRTAGEPGQGPVAEATEPEPATADRPEGLPERVAPRRPAVA